MHNRTILSEVKKMNKQLIMKAVEAAIEFNEKHPQHSATVHVCRYDLFWCVSLNWDGEAYNGVKSAFVSTDAGIQEFIDYSASI